MSGASDFWKHPYYKLAKTVTTLMGQWPYQSTGERAVIALVAFSIIGPTSISAVALAYVHWDNVEMVMDATPLFLIDLTMLVKYTNNCYHTKNMIKLLELIRYNWNIFPKNNGLHLLHHHSAFGKNFAKIYFWALWLNNVNYVTEPLQARLTVFILHQNVTLPKRFALPLEVGPIDVDKWYYYILFASGMSDMVRITFIAATDLLLFVFSQHACGFIKALGYAIEHLPPYDDSDTNDESFLYMRSCAIIHGRAIEFAELLKDTYIWSFFGVIGLNMILMSVTGVQLVTNLENMEKVSKFGFTLLGQAMHLGVECYIAQQLMDASLELKETITNAKWYNASRKTQKLIPLMLMRAQDPIVFTAGKMIPVNLDTFATVLRTAASYFTILLAMQ